VPILPMTGPASSTDSGDERIRLGCGRSARQSRRRSVVRGGGTICVQALVDLAETPAGGGKSIANIAALVLYFSAARRGRTPCQVTKDKLTGRRSETIPRRVATKRLSPINNKSLTSASRETLSTGFASPQCA